MEHRTRARKASSIGATRKHSSYSHAVLTESANILVKAGHSPKDLVEEFQRICSAIPEPSHPFDPHCILYVEGLPHIVAHWFSDPAYVDESGKPTWLISFSMCYRDMTRAKLPNRWSR
jgi:hypothetical protein